MAIVTVGDTGSGELGTSITVSFPLSYDSATDKFVVVYSRNNAGSQTFGANVTATEIENPGGRLGAYVIDPDTDSETDFTISGTNSFWSWALLKLTEVDFEAVIESSSTSIGNNTTSEIAFSDVITGYTTTGDEEIITVGGVNSTAVWTTSGATSFSTTSGNAAMIVENRGVTSGLTSVPGVSVDRGNDGSARLESSLSFVVKSVVSFTTRAGRRLVLLEM